MLTATTSYCVLDNNNYNVPLSRHYCRHHLWLLVSVMPLAVWDLVAFWKLFKSQSCGWWKCLNRKRPIFGNRKYSVSEGVRGYWTFRKSSGVNKYVGDRTSGFTRHILSRSPNPNSGVSGTWLISQRTPSSCKPIGIHPDKNKYWKSRWGPKILWKDYWSP